MTNSVINLWFEVTHSKTARFPQLESLLNNIKPINIWGLNDRVARKTQIAISLIISNHKHNIGSRHLRAEYALILSLEYLEQS